MLPRFRRCRPISASGHRLAELESLTFMRLALNTTFHEHPWGTAMASRSAFLRPGKSLFQADACIFCRARLIHQSIYRHSTSESSFGRRIENLNWRRNASLIAFMRRNYATRAMQKGPQEVRSEADTRQRAAFFELVQAEGIIAMDPKIANEIITHFLELKNIKDPSGLIKELATSKTTPT